MAEPFVDNENKIIREWELSFEYFGWYKMCIQRIIWGESEILKCTNHEYRWRLGEGSKCLKNNTTTFLLVIIVKWISLIVVI